MPKETSAPTPKCNSEQHPRSSSRGRKRKRKPPLRRKIQRVFRTAGYILIGTACLELFAYRMGSMALVASFVLSVVGFLCATIKGEIFKPSSEDKKPKKGDSLDIRLKMGWDNILNRIERSATYTLILFVALYTLTCTALATNHTVGHLLDMAQQIVEQLTDFEEPLVEDDGEIDEPFPTPPEPEEPPENSGAEESPGNITLEPPQSSDAIPSKYVAITDPDRHLTLSPERSGELYYLSGIYAAADDADIYTKVSKYVLTQVSQRQEDEFLASDSTAKVRALAYSASTKEANMEDSDDLDTVIADREAAYEEAPGAKLAKLIAENYNGYGLAYNGIDGIEDTVEFYWANSIEWLHKELAFSHSGEEIANILKQIGSRYHDLADHQTFMEKTQNRTRAGKLSDAYNTLSEYYRQENAEW